MKPYMISLAVGMLVGVIYSMLQVRSPAPPVVAILGLLGILIGEQIIPVSKHLLNGTAFVTACTKSHTIKHVFGPLPGQQATHSEEKQS